LLKLIILKYLAFEEAWICSRNIICEISRWIYAIENVKYFRLKLVGRVKRHYREDATNRSNVYHSMYKILLAATWKLIDKL